LTNSINFYRISLEFVNLSAASLILLVFQINACADVAGVVVDLAANVFGVIIDVVIVIAITVVSGLA